ATGKADFLLEERGNRLFREMEYALVREKQPGIGEIMPAFLSISGNTIRIPTSRIEAEALLCYRELAWIRQRFDLMDIKIQGTINITELKVNLHKLGHWIPNSDHAYGRFARVANAPLENLLKAKAKTSIQKHEEKPVVTKAEADARCTINRVTVERVNVQARER
ncbi:hypothetical protein Tco_0340614, partial [Tanacetum coccineum]